MQQPRKLIQSCPYYLKKRLFSRDAILKCFILISSRNSGVESAKRRQKKIIALNYVVGSTARWDRFYKHPEVLLWALKCWIKYSHVTPSLRIALTEEFTTRLTAVARVAKEMDTLAKATTRRRHVVSYARIMTSSIFSFRSVTPSCWQLDRTRRCHWT